MASRRPPRQIAVIARKVGQRRYKPLIDDRQLDRDLTRINQRTAKAMKRDFAQTVATWDERDEVVFHQKTTKRPVPRATVYTDNRTYGFVSGGTRVRRAIMSPDFKAKTSPYRLRSRPGRGRVVFISKKVELPGIQARKFPQKVERKRGSTYRKDVNAALDAAVKRGQT